TGKPVLEKVLPGVVKSNKMYYEDYQNALAEIERTQKGVEEKIGGKVVVKEKGIVHLIAEQERLTVRLYGKKDVDGKIVVAGYYDLLEEESQKQKKIRFESDVLQPLWVRDLVDVQLMLQRRERLQQRILELSPKDVAKGKS